MVETARVSSDLASAEPPREKRRRHRRHKKRKPPRLRPAFRWWHVLLAVAVGATGIGLIALLFG